MFQAIQGCRSCGVGDVIIGKVPSHERWAEVKKNLEDLQKRVVAIGTGSAPIDAGMIAIYDLAWGYATRWVGGFDLLPLMQDPFAAAGLYTVPRGGEKALADVLGALAFVEPAQPWWKRGSTWIAVAVTAAVVGTAGVLIGRKGRRSS